MPSRTIYGRRGILTGASSGIGEALAVELAARGARLVLVARREEKLRQLGARSRASAGQIEILPGDVTLPEVRHEAVARAEAAFGGLDLLINNAGIGAVGPFEAATPEDLRRVMEVNFFATAEMIRAALPVLRRGERPMVVNMGSILGHRGIPNSSEYCASKFAVRGLSESLRAEFAGLGIDLLLVSPGSTETEFFANSIRQSIRPRRARHVTPAAVVARRTIRAIERGRHEIIVNPWGKLLVWLNRISPRLVDAILARSARESIGTE